VGRFTSPDFYLKVWLALIACCAVARADREVLGRPPVGATATIDRIVALVERRPIWQSEIDRRSSLTHEEREAALSKLIDTALELNSADAHNIEPSEADIDAVIANLKKDNSLDDAALDKTLADYHYTRASYRAASARELRVQSMVFIVIGRRTVITEDEIRRAYEEAKANDPKIGVLDDKLHETLWSSMWRQKLSAETEKWLAEQRKAAHIEKR
jgi:hypothetical protein